MDSSKNALRRTPLYDWHVAAKARMVEFAGFSMPVQYTSIVKEHRMTREKCGLTDISHMGRLRFEGPGAAEFLAKTLTRRVHGLKLNQVRYSLVTNESGGILDDVLVGYYHNSTGQPHYVVVVNASNRVKIVDWINRFLTPDIANEPGKEVVFTDLTSLWAMFAIQGPNTAELLQQFVDYDLSTMKYYNGAHATILHPCAKRQGAIVSRTGYTGEDGFEISVGAEIAKDFWETLIKYGQPFGLIPTGLGARDTLRLEAGMPLYGHELSEEINPFESGVGYACYLKGYDFPGRNALVEIKAAPLKRKRIGMEVEGRRPAREGCTILDGDQEIGVTTSGTSAPSLQKAIAMGFVPPEYAEPGTKLTVDIRGNKTPATVVTLPFYKREKK